MSSTLPMQNRDNLPSATATTIHGRKLFTVLKSSLGQAIYRARLHHFSLANAGIVVAFHRVNAIAGPDNGLTCSVEMFREHCRFFARNFRVVPLRSIVEKLERREPLNLELAITFDDGYLDNFEYAVPVLRELGLPATFFIATDFIASNKVPWWDEDQRGRYSWMNWADVKTLHDEGFEIGSHTHTHADLGTASPDKTAEELRWSNAQLQNHISADVDLFAYPYGYERNMTEENRNIVKAAGMRCCCSCHGGINFTGADPFLLNRIPISSWFESPEQLGFELALRRV